MPARRNSPAEPGHRHRYLDEQAFRFDHDRRARVHPGQKLTLWPLSDGAGEVAEAGCRKIRDSRAKAGDTRLNESRVQGRIGRKIFRSEEKQKRGLR